MAALVVVVVNVVFALSLVRGHRTGFKLSRVEKAAGKTSTTKQYTLWV